MSDTDKDSKTEEPTAKKLKEAHQRGNFAKATEINAAAVLMAVLIVFTFMAHEKGREIALMATAIFSSLHEFEPTQGSVTYWASAGSHMMVGIMGPFMAAVFAAAISAGGYQSGFKFTLKAFEFNPGKFNPVTGIKKIFSKNSLVQAGIDFLKFLAVSFVIYGALQGILSDPIFHSPVPVSHSAEFLYQTFVFMLLRLVVAISIIALINFVYQKHKTKNDLKMTKEEVKEERKAAELDPKIKGQQRRMMMDIIKHQMLEEVPTADVVVTNPTHYAVALKYEQGVDMAPMVLAKGENLFAQRIKAIAKEHGVPIVENKPVARLLYRVANVGESIPVDLYGVVADILSFVYRKHRYYFHQLKRRRAERQTSRI